MTDISATIPSDKLAIATFGISANTGRLMDGDTYAEDGWVYRKDDSRSHKWFSRIEGTRIWEPILNDPVRLEARRWRILQAYQVKLRAWQLLNEELWLKLGEKDGEACSKVDGRWISISVRKTAGSKGVSTSYHESRPDMQQLGLVEQIRRADKVCCRYSGWVSRFNDALNRSLLKQLPERHDCAVGKIARLSMNGRSYWYQLGTNRWGIPEWSELARPDEDVLEVEL